MYFWNTSFYEPPLDGSVSNECDWTWFNVPHVHGLSRHRDKRVNGPA